MKELLIALCVALLMVGCGGEDDEKIEKIKHAAEQGDAAAQYELAKTYAESGLLRNTEESMRWYRKAAENGNAEAQSVLGYMYLNGEGVAKDKAMALEWLHKAAKQDHPDAYLSLGLASGDANESFNYYLKAAELENTLAQGMVGERYRKGDGVDQDLEKAFEWWLKAAEQLEFSAQYNVACCLCQRRGCYTRFRNCVRLVYHCSPILW